MDSIIYVLLGTLEAFVMMSLILKIYRMPVWGYHQLIFGCSVLISLSSFFIRMEIEMPVLDTPIQFLIFVFFLRYAMGMKTHLAAFITGAGLSAYYSLQLSIYYLFILSGFQQNLIHQNTGLDVYIIQLTSITFAIIACIILKFRGLGFSFIIEPPHDFFREEDYGSSANKMVLISGVLSFATVSLALFILYYANPLWLVLMTLITFAVSYYFSKKREGDDVREAIESYRGRNQ